MTPAAFSIKLHPHQQKRHFRITVQAGSVMSMLIGCELEPSARTLFLRNAGLIDRLLIDAKWKILRCCIAFILPFSISDVEIPVALALAPKGGRFPDEFVDVMIHDIFSIDLDHWRMVSDQGTALRFTDRQHQHLQFLCLCHFLRSLNCKM
jgi:hypothetical protein